MTMGTVSRLVCALVLLAGASACQRETPAPVDTPAAPGAAKAPALPSCVGAIGAGDKETFEIAGKKWQRDGSTLSLTGGGDTVRIGALTDIKEAAPENLANLEELVGWFKEKKVDLVVVAGDTGMSRADIENALGALAAVEVPVFNIAGNRESMKDYAAALANVQKAHANVFDLDGIRRVDTAAVDILSLPGYYNENYIHTDDGCQYSAADVEALADLVKASDSPTLLVSHGGPRQTGKHGIDRTAEGENVGDPALAAALKNSGIPFGVFGNIHEAGGHATNLDGSEVLEPGKEYPALYLNPGPADAVRWMMNDGSESIGMGAVVTVHGGKAKYEIHRVVAGKAGGKAKGKHKRKKKG